MKTNENNTAQMQSLTYDVLRGIYDHDHHETLRHQAGEMAQSKLTLLVKQFTRVQHGNSNKVPAGEMPRSMALSAIKQVWDYRLKNEKHLSEGGDAAIENRYNAYIAFEIKKLNHLLSTGTIYTRKKETIAARLAIEIERLEKQAEAAAKKLAREKEQQEKAKQKAEREAAKKQQALEKLKTANESETVTSEQIDETVEQVKSAVVSSNAAKAELLEQTDAVSEVEQELAKIEAELQKAQAKKEKLSAPRVADPNLNNVQFSKDCIDEMQDVLAALAADYSSVELLCLASLIRKQYVNSKS